MRGVVEHDFQERSELQPQVCSSCGKKSFRLCRMCGSCFLCHSDL